MTLRGQGHAQKFFEHAVTMETDDCILWPFCRHVNGYGILAVDGRYPKRVHRLAYERTYGPCPSGMQVLHGPCHNPACFNPRHLRLGTPADNAKDRVRDGTHEAVVQNLRGYRVRAATQQVSEQENPP